MAKVLAVIEIDVPDPAPGEDKTAHLSEAATLVEGRLGRDASRVVAYATIEDMRDDMVDRAGFFAVPGKTAPAPGSSQ